MEYTCALKKHFMIANIYSVLCTFHTFPCKIGGHVYRRFVVKLRASCRRETGIVDSRSRLDGI